MYDAYWLLKSLYIIHQWLLRTSNRSPTYFCSWRTAF